MAKRPNRGFDIVIVRKYDRFSQNRDDLVIYKSLLKRIVAHYLLCKGKEKATAELGLSFLVYNMKRAINMMAVKKLIEAM